MERTELTMFKNGQDKVDVLRVVCVGSLCLVLLFLVCASPLDALTWDERIVNKFVGKHWVNGRSWEKLDYAGKLGFVCGLFDGITLFWSAAEAGKKNGLEAVYRTLSIPSDLTVGDVVKGIDDFYRDVENKELPAICAYLFYAFKVKGDSPEAVEKRLKAWRKMFSH